MGADKSQDVAVQLKLQKQKQYSQGVKQAGKDTRKFGDDTKRASKSLDIASRSSLRLRTGLLSLGVSARNGVALGFAAATAEVFRATKGYADHMAVVRRTNAVVKSTGGVAGITAKQVGRLSDSLERQTGVDGDLIQSGANMLLTFTNVRNGIGKNNKIFDQATSTLIGMSQALGSDPKQAAIQLGKALNDPVKGITALSKVGVSFTEDQKKQIKVLVKSGKTMQAQKMILGELNKEFPKVKATPFEKMMVTVHALEDDLGSVFLPLSNRLFKSISKLGTAIEPSVSAVAADINKIIAGKNTDLGQKLALSLGSVRQHLGPFAAQLEQGLKDAHLDEKLRNAVEWAIPKITSGARLAGVKSAEAFGTAFLKADPLGQLLIGGYILKKLGAGGALAKGLGGLFAGKKGGALGGLFGSRGNSPANPLFVAVINGGAGTGLPGKTPKGGKVGNVLGKVGGFAGGLFGAIKNVPKVGIGLAGASVGATLSDKLDKPQSPKMKKALEEAIARSRGTDNSPPDPRITRLFSPKLSKRDQNVFKSGLDGTTQDINIYLDGKQVNAVIDRRNTNKHRRR